MNKSSSKEIIQNIQNAFPLVAIEQDEFKEKFSAYDIRDAFLEFISSFMQNYKKYMNLNEKSLNMDFNSLFNFKDFLSDNKQAQQGSFLQKLTTTNLFVQFLERKLSNQADDQQKLNNFDKCLLIKRTKKFPNAINPEQIQKIFQCPSPVEKDLPEGQKYFQYQIYPILNKNLIIQSQNNYQYQQVFSQSFEKIDPIELASYSDNR